LFHPLNRGELKVAVDRWINEAADRSALITTHGDINTWDTSLVTDMSYMFSLAFSLVNDFNHEISSWDVSAVTSMNGMFQDATAFNKDLDSWDVSAVTDMSLMFRSATDFNQDLDSWDVSAVTTMVGMFFGAAAFNQQLCWDVSGKVTTDMFSSSGGSIGC
jgi:surface protein